jgi:hypothetical protein
MSDIWAFIFKPDAATTVFFGTVLTLVAVVLVGEAMPSRSSRDQLGILISSGEPILMSEPIEVSRKPSAESKYDLQIIPQLLREGRAADG